MEEVAVRTATKGMDIDPLLGPVERCMTRQVVTVPADSPLGTAARLLESAGVSGAPVEADGRVVGMVSLKDLLGAFPNIGAHPSTTGPFHRWEHVLDELSLREGRTVRDVMIGKDVSVRPETPLRHAARLMIQRGVDRLPVTDAEGRPRGVLARSDIVAAVARIALPVERHPGRKPMLAPD